MYVSLCLQLPPVVRATALDVCSNYVEVGPPVTATGTARHYDNTFILSSWAPCLAPVKAAGGTCLVSYNCPAGRQPHASLVQGTVDNTRCHPDFSIRNLLISLLLPTIQGRGNIHFAGSYTTPGNGHDLSLLSGLLAATRIGAPYPFAADRYPAAHADFLQAAGFMGDRSILAIVGRRLVLLVVGLWVVYRWRARCRAWLSRLLFHN